MGEAQAFGVFLVALGALVFFFIAQLWSRTRKDPLWILRGEFRDVLRPQAARVLTALLIGLGAMLGSGAVGYGLMLLRWV